MTIEAEDLGRPASLTLWPTDPDAPKAVVPRDYPTLTEALARAGVALGEESAAPWIITESGLILTPAWLRGHHRDGAATAAVQQRKASVSSALPALPGPKRQEGGRGRADPLAVAMRMRGVEAEAVARS